MTAQTQTQKTAYYRRAVFDKTVTQNLQQLVQHALTQQVKVKSRSEPTDAAASSFRVVSSSKVVNGLLCGTLVSFERGSFQLVISDDPEATSLSISAIEPPKAGAVQQQYVPGVLFFAIFENHLAIVHSQSLKTSGLEQHLVWLLRSETGLLGNTQGLVLSDEIKKATKDRIRKSHVKSMSIGRPFMTQPDANSGGIELGMQKSVTKLAADPGIVGFLKSWLPEDRFSKFDFENAVFDGDLEVWLELRYPSYTRSQPEDTIKLMDNLAIALRDQDEDSIALTLADGTKVKGSELKITTNVSLKSVAGVPQEEAFYTDLAAWVRDLIKNGMVSS